MVRVVGRLTALKVSRVGGKPGLYADGGGLYLQVTPGGASWVFRFMIKGRAREMGLGPLRLYSLQEARAMALDAARLRHEGVDPIEARHVARASARLSEAKAVTFKQSAKSYIKALIQPNSRSAHSVKTLKQEGRRKPASTDLICQVALSFSTPIAFSFSTSWR